jgi:hypothetical protein
MAGVLAALMITMEDFQSSHTSHTSQTQPKQRRNIYMYPIKNGKIMFKLLTLKCAYSQIQEAYPADITLGAKMVI